MAPFNGAKRTSQWYSINSSEGVFACAAYSSCSISLTLANKAIFSSTKLNFPWSILLTQSVVVALLFSIYFTSGIPKVKDTNGTISRDLLKQLSIPTVFFTLFIFSNARALSTVSLPLLTVLKSLAPLCVALAERVVFGDRVTGGTYMAMGLIGLGNLVAVTGDGGFHMGGYLWALFNILCNVAYVISLRFCLADTFTPAQKTFHSNIIAVVFITPVATVLELREFYTAFQETNTRFRILFFLSCILAAGIGASVFWVLKAASGSTLSFVGATNKVFVVILGNIFFETKVSPRGWIGVVLGILAGGCFAISKSLGKNANDYIHNSKQIQSNNMNNIVSNMKIKRSSSMSSTSPSTANQEALLMHNEDEEITK